jgi:hypothetical protein
MIYHNMLLPLNSWFHNIVISSLLTNSYQSFQFHKNLKVLLWKIHFTFTVQYFFLIMLFLFQWHLLILFRLLAYRGFTNVTCVLTHEPSKQVPSFSIELHYKDIAVKGDCLTYVSTTTCLFLLFFSIDFYFSLLNFSCKIFFCYSCAEFLAIGLSGDMYAWGYRIEEAAVLPPTTLPPIDISVLRFSNFYSCFTFSFYIFSSRS